MSKVLRTSLLRSIILVLAVVGLALSSLGLSSFVPASTASAESTISHVRVLHVGSDAPALTVIVNGNKVIENLPFGHITGYINFSTAITYNVKVVASSAPDVALFEISGASIPAGYYTIAAIGLLHPGNTGKAFALKVYTDINMIVRGKSRLRVVDALPTLPDVDVYAGRIRLVTDATYPIASGYLVVAPVHYVLGIAAHPSRSAKQVIFFTPRLKLQPGVTYTAWVMGKSGSHSTVLLTSDYGSTHS